MLLLAFDIIGYTVVLTFISALVWSVKELHNDRNVR